MISSSAEPFSTHLPVFPSSFKDAGIESAEHDSILAAPEGTCLIVPGGSSWGQSWTNSNDHIVDGVTETIEGKTRDHVSRAHCLNQVKRLALDPRPGKSGISVYDKNFDPSAKKIIANTKIITSSSSPFADF